jgi:hypothetical protein
LSRAGSHGAVRTRSAHRGEISSSYGRLRSCRPGGAQIGRWDSPPAGAAAHLLGGSGNWRTTGCWASALCCCLEPTAALLHLAFVFFLVCTFALMCLSYA